MFRLPLNLLSPAGRRARLTILMYHRVLPSRDALYPSEPDVVDFEEQMQWVKEWFQVLPLSTAVTMLYEQRLPARALAITFDDGYADNERLAAPVLRKLGLSGTFFVTTGFLDGATMWNDRLAEAIRGCAPGELDLRTLGLSTYSLVDPATQRGALKEILARVKYLEPARRGEMVDGIAELARARPIPALMMSREQVRSLRRMGMEVGAHTVTHPILARIDRTQARNEMGGSKEALEQILGEPVKLFAYPNGVPGRDFSADNVELVRECGFDAAVTTAADVASMASHRFQLPRFAPWSRSRLRYGARLALNLARTNGRAHLVAASTTA